MLRRSRGREGSALERKAPGRCRRVVADAVARLDDRPKVKGVVNVIDRRRVFLAASSSPVSASRASERCSFPR
jgi:hypothetical protein